MSQSSNCTPNVDAAAQEQEDHVHVDQQLAKDVTKEQRASGTDVTREQCAPRKVFSLLPNCYILLT